MNLFKAVVLYFFSLWIRFLYFSKKKHIKNLDALKKELENNDSVIMVGWHSRSMLFGPYWSCNLKKYKIFGIFSKHNDGQLNAKLFSFFRFGSIWGSTTSGGVSVLKNSIKELLNGNSLIFTPDGPRGPSMELSKSITYLSKKTGKPIVPIVISYSNSKFLNTWDQYVFVKPFGKAVFEILPPYYIKKDINPDMEEKIRLEIETKMCEKTWKYDKEMGLPKAKKGVYKKKKNE